MTATPRLRRVGVRIRATASLLLTILGTVIFLAGSFSEHALGSALGLCLVFTVPAGLLFSFCMFRVQTGNLRGAITLSVVGGSIVAIAAAMAATASAYANPCFEIARCSQGASFGYGALLAAMSDFLVTAALGLFVSPIALGFAADTIYEPALDAGHPFTFNHPHCE
jgi:hypothetical protein